MLTIMAIAGVALGIVVLAIRIVIGWISAPAGLRFDRAVRFASGTFLKLIVVGTAAAIVAVIWMTLVS